MEDKEVLVRVEGLSKKFCKDLKKSLWYGVQDLFSNIRGNKEERFLRDQEFWALKDISFELRRGECLGLIGHNGAGKSTLLKILNGLIYPDAGKVTIKGRVGALIELGAGFNPILTGRENIYNNGAILGFTRKEINEKLDEIIDFAEIREFIDMPVQNYSSGMKVRLGFAIAVQMEPDVLIIDEVLAVGDVKFKAKCFNILESLINRCAVIIVSHSMPQISRICTDLILLNKGEIIAYDTGEFGNTLEKYLKLVGESISTQIGNGNLKIEDVFINFSTKNLVDVNYYKPFNLLLKLRFIKIVEAISIKVTFFDAEQKAVAELSSINDRVNIGHDGFNNFLHVNIDIDKLPLNLGKYSLHIVVREINDRGNEGEILHLIRSAKNINVIGNSYYSHAPCLLKGYWEF